MNNNPKELLITLLSDYLPNEDVIKILNNKIKAKAWFRLFKGYSDKELEEIMISIYSYFPDRLPSIQEIKEKCIYPIDKTKYQQEWHFLWDIISQSISHDETHNSVYSQLSEEAKIALKDFGGILGLKNDLNPQYKEVHRKDFIANCQKYKEQLRSGLIDPLRVELRDTKRPDPIFLSKEDAKKHFEEIRLNLESQGIKL